ncbi:alpha-amylase [Lacicoccus alkaliphilus]|uniref:Uncharacterized protein n=1 Tax=Lacicoccus alkaliphilus DSM 16010 TaxID=1123231 RepID=A0A1M7J7Y6_9BACL|nr:alpha-amylase [Salinicoccus alkaliphilus]SHM49136.1 hypothetical protein SAMN02745189_02248 [Salinicoccus alkaliphilus DSM 16010]
MKKLIVILILFAAVILVLTLPLAPETSDTERVIVDHTLGVVVHPVCFEEAGLTNYIDEVSYSNAMENYEYEILGECSEERLQTGRTSILSKIFD